MQFVITGKIKRFGPGKKGNYAKVEVKRTDGQDDDLIVTGIPSLDGFAYGKSLTVMVDGFVQFGKCVKIETIK